ncbi:MAG: fused MFS/spermidine synthase [Alphaproteobacteria bacterium]|nr:fused MFS/spermidine synthase [Alphaproteobacteria bacterium]
MTWSQFSYRLCVFLSAACGLVVEIVAGRMLAPYVGMSIYSWTAVIAVVLAGMSLGNWLGGFLAERSRRRAMLWLTVAFVGGAVSTVGALGLIRIVSEGILTALPNPVAGIVALTAALFFVPSLCVGIPAPILTELAMLPTAPRA